MQLRELEVHGVTIEGHELQAAPFSYGVFELQRA
jgi:hypothetical protein